MDEVGTSNIKIEYE